MTSVDPNVCRCHPGPKKRPLEGEDDDEEEVEEGEAPPKKIKTENGEGKYN